MKSPIDILSGLGERLQSFGADALSQQALAEACSANGWFTPSEVRRAVAAVARDMLCRKRLEEWLAAYPAVVVSAPRSTASSFAAVPVSASPATRVSPAAPKRVLVIMAGNIPLVGFFDLLCVVASGHRCLIKPSAKDTVLMEYIVGLLRDIEPEVAVEFYDGHSPVDAVIATGSDNANRYFRAHYAGIPSLLRASRHSVAVLSGDETPEQLAGLSDDIWAYSGLGCRNVSLIFAPEGYEVKLQMPAVNKKYTNNYTQIKALLQMTGKPYLDLGAAVAVEQREFPLPLSCMAIARYRDLSEVGAWLADRDGDIQCVVTECLAHPRRAGFGCAQSPALTDYPDQKDVMTFLTGI